MKPYKLKVPEFGSVDVIDRETNEVVAYCLQDFHGSWEWFLISDRGVVKGRRRLRADAAAEAWDGYQFEKARV